MLIGLISDTHIDSIAAPTAGLHMTRPLLERVGQAGTSVVPITLHVNVGTFSPIRTKRVEDHIMASEFFEIGPGLFGIITIWILKIMVHP